MLVSEEYDLKRALQEQVDSLKMEMAHLKEVNKQLVFSNKNLVMNNKLMITSNIYSGLSVSTSQRIMRCNDITKQIMDVMASFEPIQLICDTKGIFSEAVQNHLQPLLSAWSRAISIEDLFPARYTRVNQTNVKGRAFPSFGNVLDALNPDHSISIEMERLYYSYSDTMFRNTNALKYLRVNQQYKSQLDAYIAIICTMSVFRIIGGPITTVYPPTSPIVIDYNDKNEMSIMQQVATDLNLGPYQPRSQSGWGFHFRNNQPQMNQPPMKRNKNWQNNKRGKKF